MARGRGTPARATRRRPAPAPHHRPLPRGARVGAHRHHQDLLVTVRVGLHRHVLDDHALDAQHLPEYPGLAHAVPFPVVPVLCKTKTTAEHGMSHQNRWSDTHYNVTRAGSELASSPPASEPCSHPTRIGIVS